MRQKRKKKFMHVLIIQFMAIYCGLLFWALKFHSETSAAYNDIEHVSLQITADWKSKDKDKGKDKSEKQSLSFIKQEVHCYNGLISAVIRNAFHSSTMKNLAVYEVYWSDTGKPKPEYGGQKIQSGTVPVLRSGETFAINVKVTKPGQYIFKVNYSGYEIWSETLQVGKKCIDKFNPPKGNHKSTMSTDQVIQEESLESENSTQIEIKDELREPNVTKDEVQAGGDEESHEAFDTLD